MNRPAPRTELRSYTLSRSGHFEAAHYLPYYTGKCQVLHGHRWEVTATIEFPIVPRAMVSHEDPDGCGMLVDFHDIDELWEEYDHPEYGPFNVVIPNPTAEVIANILLEALCDLVEDSLGVNELPFNASITLLESPDSVVTVSMYQPTFVPEELDTQDEPWAAWPRKGIAESGQCQCPGCREERDMPREASPVMP